jgi:hypothetical protein
MNGKRLSDEGEGGVKNDKVGIIYILQFLLFVCQQLFLIYFVRINPLALFNDFNRFAMPQLFIFYFLFFVLSWNKLYRRNFFFLLESGALA